MFCRISKNISRNGLEYFLYQPDRISYHTHITSETSTANLDNSSNYILLQAKLKKIINQQL